MRPGRIVLRRKHGRSAVTIHLGEVVEAGRQRLIEKIQESFAEGV